MKVEVIEKKDNQSLVDWSVKPQILEFIGDCDNFKVVYLGDGDDYARFKGIVLTTQGTGWKHFQIDTCFYKELFRPFNEVITIQN